MSVIKKIKKFKNLSFKEKKLLTECIITLVKTSLLIEFFPLKWIKRELGAPVTNANIDNNYSYDEIIVKQIIKNIYRASKLIPWKIKCYPQALTGKILLKKNKINSYLYLGLNKDRHTLHAHAWLKVGNKIIIGNTNLEQFKIVNIFS